MNTSSNSLFCQPSFGMTSSFQRSCPILNVYATGRTSLPLEAATSVYFLDQGASVFNKRY